MTEPPKVRKLHYVFEISVILKGLQALAEIFSGAALVVTPHVKLISFIAEFTAHEDGGGGKDLVLTFLAQTASEL